MKDKITGDDREKMAEETGRKKNEGAEEKKNRERKTKNGNCAERKENERMRTEEGEMVERQQDFQEGTGKNIEKSTGKNAGRFRQKLLAYMKQHRMTAPGDRILTALSGGADSVCLLHFLHEVSEELGIWLAAFHMNHGIRGAEADRDEAFVRELCEKFGIPLTVAHENVEAYAKEYGLSTEEAGRILRYRHLEETAEKYGCEKIAVAHHQDDDAETVLLNLFRGSGFSGLSGIRPVRGKIIRPLLCVSKDEITEYLTGQGISWCEDSTNRENDYMRNRVRNELLPWVKENINRQAGEHILAVADLAAQSDAYFEAEAERILRESRETGRKEENKNPEKANSERADLQAAKQGKTETEKGKNGEQIKLADGREEQSPPDCKISVRVLDSQPEILKTYIIRRMIVLAAGKAKDITNRHIQSVMELSGPGGGCRVDLPYGLMAVRGYETLKIVKSPEKTRKRKGTPAEKTREENEKREKQNAIFLDLNAICKTGPKEIILTDGTRIRFCTTQRKKESKIPKNQYTKWFDYDKINDGLSIRYRKNGDYFTLPGGGKKKLSRYMIDEKIPEKGRDQIPLLADKDHVLWVIGYRISDYYKITDATEKILEAEVILPDRET